MGGSGTEGGMTSERESAQAMTNAELDAAISSAANGTSFADLLAARGETTVVMDADGSLLVRHPDGRTDRSQA